VFKLVSIKGIEDKYKIVFVTIIGLIT